MIEMKAGDVFYITPGHDSWVVGNEPYVSFHFLGGDAYASHKSAIQRFQNFMTAA